MKKLISLIKASMTSDMNIFKIKQKKDKNKKSSLPIVIFISLLFMFAIWSNANTAFEGLAPQHLQNIVLAIFVFLVSILTIGEGTYKTGSLLFNCKDDQLLLSLPIKRRTVLFLRIFKFYVFELLFNALFIVPLAVAYIRWADHLEWTFFLNNIIMIFILPIIPIVISCIIGAIVTSISSRFKYKNAAQIIVSAIFLLGILAISMNLNNIINYLSKHATSIGDMINKIYYPAGIYAELCTSFSVTKLLIFILVNILIFVTMIFVLSKVYFKINSRMKKVTNTKKITSKELVIRKRTTTNSLIHKELKTFFKTPVFIVNAGFGLLLFLIITILIIIKFDAVVQTLVSNKSMHLTKAYIMNNTSVLIYVLISSTAFMTSITNSVISLEGRNINILKSLPVKTKTILMSKIYSSLIITTPVILLGDILLFIKLKTGIIDILLLIIMSILIPLVSHFIGLIINIKFPKLDAENSAEVVKQSTSSLVSVMIGIGLFMVNIMIIYMVVGELNQTILLTIITLIYVIIDSLLYLYLVKKSTKQFNELTI